MSIALTPPNWEKGNDDRSLYVVRSFSSRVLTAAEVAKPICAERNGS